MNALRADRVAALLETRRLGRSLRVLSETGSTNDDARADAKLGMPDGHAVVADTQTRGRGARGRSWSSPPGVDLYVSVLAHVSQPLSALPPLTLAVGVAVAETVDTFAGGKLASIKWPNDVWLEGKKVAGILIEGASSSQQPEPLVIGIGLNVNRRDFPGGLDTEPTSLALCAGVEREREQVLVSLLSHLETWLDRFASHGPLPIVDAVNQRLALRDKLARCEEHTGTVLGVADSGALRMHCEGGVREIHAGTLRALG
jgi:BirA family biotin operon repressor/biotin-[acetyl-CoA-carboxylase] ligase